MAIFAPRYAQAFADAARANGLDAEAAEREMREFEEILAESAPLREVLMNPSIPMTQKLKVLDALVPRVGISPKVRNFLAVILEHDRLGSLSEIIAAYAGLVDKGEGAAEATVTSARPLSNEDRTMLEEQIAKRTGSRVKATYVEDATLLGGAVVQVGSTIYDGSVKAQLERLKHVLSTAS